ncbi:flagellar basal body-associated protein [Terriglobus roseus DSM 18391]|uniref:Flagellar protein FliL n=1 Tax=Terriglobus roseus (strain DSM 18391 / NRRL B-41598 / KBS 63) TaxID=926566 RepID=I3ZFV9_TERRK|nr:flagellar basal body-associated FliL family protein [Terriglobus roseus]AFL88127.1 flagellar basal body-associated protein [Terriglobus roseus DSM 18391]
MSTSPAEIVPNGNVAIPPKVGVTAILLPVLLSTVLALGSVGVALYWLTKSGKLGAATAASVARPIIVVAPPASHVLALEPMIVNLSDDGGRSYLRATVSLRIKDEPKTEEKTDPKSSDGLAAALRDSTLSVLTQESADSLLIPEGRDRLKAKLQQEFKLRNSETSVLEVYFTDFLVQRG